MRDIDEHGLLTLDPSMPEDVQGSDQSVERWQMCAAIAEKFTGVPPGQPENGAFARVLYEGPYPMHDDEAPPLQEAENYEFERLRRRDRLGRFASTADRRIPRRRLKGHEPYTPRTTLKKIEELGLNAPLEPSDGARKLLDGHDTTADRYYAKDLPPQSPGSSADDPHPPYTAARGKLHNLIVGQTLAPVIQGILDPGDPIVEKLSKGGGLTDEEKQRVRDAAHDDREGEAPEVLFMAGGPASGKTRTLDANPYLAPRHSVRISADNVKDKLPEFAALVADKDRYAASAVHLESGDIASRLADEAQDLRLNMVVDGTGNDSPEQFLRQLSARNDAGYDVSVLYANTSTNEAVVWAVDRADEIGRFVPIPELRRKHARVSANFPHVEEVPWVQDLYVFDHGNLIGEKREGIFHELDHKAMNEFRAKAGEHR